MPVKALLFPLTASLLFFAWMLLLRQDLDGPHFLVALLGAIAAGELCSTEHPSLTPAPSEFLRLAAKWLAFVVVIWGGIELAQLRAELNIHVLIGVALSTPPVLWMVSLGVRRMGMRGHLRINARRKAVVIGMTDIGTRWEERLESENRGEVQIVGYFDDRQSERLPHDHLGKLKGNMADAPGFVREQDVRVVYVALPMSRQPRIVDLLGALQDSTASVYFVLDVFAFNPVQAHLQSVGGIPLVAVRESPFSGPESLPKRTLDLLIAILALVGLAIPMLLIAVAVRISSPGPVIFKQKRYGLDGKSIMVFKFRTMTVTEDGDRSYQQVQRGDSRITPVGAFLRATSMDELPQLINVLFGTMSIVGPRPHAVAVNEQYRRLIPSYMLRHKVKPGITGLAQVNGYRGGDDLPSMTKRIEYDLAYLQHWSLLLDLRIMYRTALMVLTDRNAF